MAARRSRMSGDFKLRKTLRNIHQTMDNNIKVAMQEAADLVLQTQQQMIPVDSGDGKAALTAFVSKSGLDAQIGIRGKKENKRFFYLGIIEVGTKGYTGEKGHKGRKRKRNNQSDGATFFGNYPDMPARPAHPWLRPSYDINKETIIKILEDAVADTLRRASEGATDG